MYYIQIPYVKIKYICNTYTHAQTTQNKENITTTPLDSYDAIVEATNDIDESPTDAQCEDITPSDESVEEVKLAKPKRAPKKESSYTI